MAKSVTDEQLTEFIRQYQEMRTHQTMAQKTRDNIHLAKALKIQLQLDRAAPILLELLEKSPND